MKEVNNLLVPLFPYIFFRVFPWVCWYFCVASHIIMFIPILSSCDLFILRSFHSFPSFCSSFSLLSFTCRLISAYLQETWSGLERTIALVHKFMQVSTIDDFIIFDNYTTRLLKNSINFQKNVPKNRRFDWYQSRVIDRLQNDLFGYLNLGLFNNNKCPGEQECHSN